MSRITVWNQPNIPITPKTDQMRTFSIISALALSIYLISGCAKPGFDVNLYSDEDYEMMSEYINIPQALDEYDLFFPSYYRRTSTSIDDRVATVGRVLFYDKNLSKDRSVSCASCHEQNIAFSDSKAFSEGIEGKTTLRNSIALGSVFSFQEYYGPSRIPFFWDNRAESVEDQSEQTFANKNEMGMEMHEVLGRVLEQPYYQPLFESAFKEEVITRDMVLQAISVFVNSIGSFDSKFDQELAKKHTSGFASNVAQSAEMDFEGFTAAENRGKSIYMANCSSCHSADMGAPSVRSANNGLSTSYEDLGLGEHSPLDSNEGLFKVPTLRNIALTGPYMHDGSIETLSDVIDHYSEGIQDYKNLSQDLKKSDGSPKNLNLSENNKSDLLAFLHTLTDESLLVNERFSDPFID